MIYWKSLVNLQEIRNLLFWGVCFQNKKILVFVRNQGARKLFVLRCAIRWADESEGNKTWTVEPEGYKERPVVPEGNRIWTVEPEGYNEIRDEPEGE